MELFKKCCFPFLASRFMHFVLFVQCSKLTDCRTLCLCNVCVTGIDGHNAPITKWSDLTTKLGCFQPVMCHLFVACSISISLFIELKIILMSCCYDFEWLCLTKWNICALHSCSCHIISASYLLDSDTFDDTCTWSNIDVGMTQPCCLRKDWSTRWPRDKSQWLKSGLEVRDERIDINLCTHLLWPLVGSTG